MQKNLALPTSKNNSLNLRNIKIILKEQKEPFQGLCHRENTVTSVY